MEYKISFEASALAESLKAAQNYVKKDAGGEDALSQILLAYLPRDKKLAVIACDGHGYFERKLPVSHDKKVSKSGLPKNGFSVCLSLVDSQAIVKLIPARSTGYVTLEISENENQKHDMRLLLPTGPSAAFTVRSDIEIPDYAAMRSKACKGKKKAVNLNDVNIAVHEMLRAGKALPSRTGSTVKAFTAEGRMILLEYLDDVAEITIIFTFATVAQAA